MPLSQRVLFGSLEHLLPITLAIIITVMLIRFSINQEETIQYKIFKYLGVFVSGFMLIFHLYQIGFEDYNI
ncbi:MAG: TIGR02206 family membrane protein, partial [Flavobacteriaceae bacterium]|nr:TIGR02206 family membrane protein [Flavobacteriaceae bacterium]